MNEDIRNDVNLVMQKVYDNTKGGRDSEPEEEEVIHVHHFPDARLIEFPDGTILFKKSESTTTNIPIVESARSDTDIHQAPQYPAILTVCAFLFLVLFSLMFQFYVIFHPPTVTVTIIPKSEQLSLNGKLQLGRVLTPITLSQSATTQATGKGHQDARSATGTVTFYNGQLQSVTVPAGTILTGSSGTQIATDQDANIPPESQTIPPTFGQATVSAHALLPGTKGNILTGDINQSCCATSILVQNTAPFHGGEDERDFTIVTKGDIELVAATLKTTLAQSMQGALTGQLKSGEALVTPTCTPTVTSDHQIGQEATQVTVTASETCSGIVYNQDALQAQVTKLLTQQAIQKLGAGYSLLGTVQITVAQATNQNKTVVLSFVSQGTYVHALSDAAQQHIKALIKGKTGQEALHILQSVPEIESASIHWFGFGDDTRVPKDLRNIHLVLIYGL